MRRFENQGVEPAPEDEYLATRRATEAAAEALAEDASTLLVVVARPSPDGMHVTIQAGFAGGSAATFECMRENGAAYIADFIARELTSPGEPS